MTQTYGYTGSSELVTISTTGTYDLTAYGAQGGEFVVGSNNVLPGGAGAAIGGDIYLTAGTQLEIMVGGAGGVGVLGTYAGGGGGASYVYEVASGGNTLLDVAGGGGGAAAGGGGGGGLIGTVGGGGATGFVSGGLAGGVSYAGGGGGQADAAGGGGHGTYGGVGGVFGAGAGGGGGGGIGFTTGVGGYGGGGHGGGAPLSFSLTHAAFGGGGGGGGYGGGGGGGGGGSNNPLNGGYGGGGGGGGSYFEGLTSTAEAGVHSGEGEVTLQLLTPETDLLIGGTSSGSVNWSTHGTPPLTPWSLGAAPTAGQGNYTVLAIGYSTLDTTNSTFGGHPWEAVGDLTLTSGANLTLEQNLDVTGAAGPGAFGGIGSTINVGTAGVSANLDVGSTATGASGQVNVVHGSYAYGGAGNTETVTVDPGAIFTDHGSGAAGAVNLNGGTFIENDSSATTTVNMSQGGTCYVLTPFAGQITNFNTAGQIWANDSNATPFLGFVTSPTTVMLTFVGGASYTLNFDTTQNLTVTPDGNYFLITSSTPVCFVAGSLILTSGGDVAVENLRVGDLAVTASGEVRPITWIGRRRIERPARAQRPVRVMAGAFGERLPARDLFLSPGHAVCVSVMDELFVPVGELLNGATISQVDISEITYWHVELESHDVLLAEGLPCESYMDAGNRAWFGRQFGRLEMIDTERVAERHYARPFVDRGPIVEAIRARLAARAEALGWTRESHADLHLLVDGERVDPDIEGDLVRFVFPGLAKDARLVSRTFVPGADRRMLGVRIDGLHIYDGLRSSREIPLGEIAGFHPEEAAAGLPWRWTDGDLALPCSLWADCRGIAILRLAFAPGMSWIEPADRAVRVRAARSAAS